MALTITKVTSPTQPQRVAQQLTVEFDALFDANYPTGGLALLPATIGLGKITRIETETSTDGRVFYYDPTNQKLKAYQSAGSAAALAEVPNGTSLALTSTRCMAWGY